MEREFGVWENYDWDSGEGINKGMESKFLVRSPDEGYVFFRQSKQGSCNVRVVLNKAVVKVTKA